MVLRLDGDSISPCLQALEEALAPRLQLMGASAALEEFGNVFRGQSLEKGTNIVMMYRLDGDAALELKVQSGGSLDFSQVCPQVGFEVKV